MKPASQQGRGTAAPVAPARRSYSEVKGSGQDAQPSRGSPSSTGGQQAAPRRPPTPPNPFGDETSSGGKNPFGEETSSAGKNPFGDDIDGDDKNNPFFN